VYYFNLTFTAIANALAEWKTKKEASLHGGEDLGQPQEEEEEEEENIYAVAPEPDVRECCIFDILPCRIQQNETSRSGICMDHTGIQECIQKFLDWLPGARTANGTVLCHEVQLYHYFVSQFSEFYHHNPLCYFSRSVCCCCFLFCY
jgi:hypothetical protein